MIPNDGYGEELVGIYAAKRLGVEQWQKGEDWFTSWSPRNANTNAEGTWAEWVTLARMILDHPRTKAMENE